MGASSIISLNPGDEITVALGVNTITGFDFDIITTDTNGIVTQGSDVSDTVRLTLLSGTTQPVSLSASGLPSGADASFSPISCNPGCISQFTIITSPTTAIGDHVITITGTGGWVTHSTDYVLIVNPSTTARPVSLIKSPAAGSLQITDFFVYVTDPASASRCYYAVFDQGGPGVSKTERFCNSPIKVTVGPTGHCRTKGIDTCNVRVSSSDSAGEGPPDGRSFSISYSIEEPPSSTTTTTTTTSTTTTTTLPSGSQGHSDPCTSDADCVEDYCCITNSPYSGKNDECHSFVDDLHEGQCMGSASITTTTTTTTIPGATMIIEITTTELLRGVEGTINVDIGSGEGRIDIDNVTIRYTTIFSNILSDPNDMSCTGDTSIAECTYSLTPETTWITPMHVMVLVADVLGGPTQQAEADINLVDELSTTTTILEQNVTTTTLPVEGLIVNITNQNLTLNEVNEIRVLLGDELCRLDKDKVHIRHTTFLPIKVEPKNMACTDGTCIIECGYSITPEANWVSPVELTVIVNLSGQLVPVDKSLDIVEEEVTTTTTTSTTLGGATTTTVPIDLTVIVPDLRELQQELSSIKDDVDDLAERLRDIEDTRYRRYQNIGGDIEDAIDGIKDIINQVYSNPRSATNRDAVVNELINLKNSIQQIVDEL